MIDIGILNCDSFKMWEKAQNTIRGPLKNNQATFGLEHDHLGSLLSTISAGWPIMVPLVTKKKKKGLSHGEKWVHERRNISKGYFYGYCYNRNLTTEWNRAMFAQGYRTIRIWTRPTPNYDNKTLRAFMTLLLTLTVSQM